MEFRAITSSTIIFKKCCTENLKIIYLIRDRRGEKIPDCAELKSFEGGKIEFSYGEKTFFKREKRIIIEDCFPDRSKFVATCQRTIGNTKLTRGQTEREIEDISIMHFSDAIKNEPHLYLRSANIKPADLTWVYVLTLKPIH